MHQAIQGCNGARTWEEFKKTLLRSRLIQKRCDLMKKSCACKICGEIGHTHEEHKDGSPHCEKNHPAEECPTRQVTCFLCQGTTHYPAQCHIYPKVREITKQQKQAVKETLKENSEEPAMKEVIQDPDGDGLNRFFAQAYYSCGEEGHFSEYCTKESREYLEDFPAAEVKFDPREIEAPIIMEISRKRKRRHPQNNPISAEKDLGSIPSFKCKTLCHYANMCPEKKPEKEPRTQKADTIPKKPKDLSEVICFRCKEAEHYADECPYNKEAGVE
nr:uncharacterized protein LOC109769268 [Aegilops tauschii subsp. strangulata]